LSAARARAGGRWAAGEERERGREKWAEPAQEEKGGGQELHLGFSFYKTFLTLFISYQLLFVL
ncbi:hypothetical protein M2T59_28660, partial [Klebsiella pneumoniae]|nr:hypothetical protein [Klebsiella pneumoniae]